MPTTKTKVKEVVLICPTFNWLVVGVEENGQAHVFSGLNGYGARRVAIERFEIDPAEIQVVPRSRWLEGSRWLADRMSAGLRAMASGVAQAPGKAARELAASKIRNG